METSEQLPRGAVEAPDLAELVRRSGPFLSVYLNTEGGTEDATQRSQTRWKTVRSDLDDQDVPDAVLERGELGTGAGIRVVDDADRLAESVGALLRWTTG